MMETLLMSGFFYKGSEKQGLGELCPSLTFTQKLMGFGICIAIGIVLDILAWLSFHKLVQGHPATFAICFSLGVLVTLAGSAFLVGLTKQVKTMFKKKRIITTCVVLISLVMTIIAALWIKSAPLTLFFMIIEMISYTWYVLSYLPFAQSIVKRIGRSCCNF